MMSASQLWRQYKRNGGTLNFKDWVTRENSKQASMDGVSGTDFIGNKSLNDSIQNMLTRAESSELKTEISNKTVFGIDKRIIMVGSVIVIGAIAYKVYQNRKKG